MKKSGLPSAAAFRRAFHTLGCQLISIHRDSPRWGLISVWKPANFWGVNLVGTSNFSIGDGSASTELAELTRARTDNITVKVITFMAGILPRHPDSGKFRESLSQFHPPQTQSYEGGFHFFI